MNHFDIEKLNRKNIYKTSEQLFEKVQDNVLKQTVDAEKTTHTIGGNRTLWYAIAAAVVLLFGIGLFITSISDTLPNDALAQTEGTDTAYESNVKQPYHKISPENDAKTELSEINPIIENEPYLAQNETSAKIQSPATKTNQYKKEITTLRKTTENVEQIVASFTSADITELSKEAEVDVYLDLY
ncbi:hypothetical protein BPO_1365 [Bergeyella porcorum]|uniref:Uncharacterized protein n=1 Tax=Bergeyella porcorum TaxID=1735111 RepID=A0AAU0EZY4_9FLAO